MSSLHLSLLDRCYALRDRLLASPKFQRWAASFPLTRPIAQRRARAIFDLGAGFVYSQVLRACLQLNLFDILYEGPQELTVLAQRFNLSVEATVRLLKAARSLQLVSQKSETIYRLGPLGAALAGNTSVIEMIKHHHLLYADLHDPLALLRGENEPTQLSQYWAYARQDNPASLKDGNIFEYSRLMSVSQAMIIEDVLDAFSLKSYKCLLDVGGGEGFFVKAAVDRNPELEGIVFDLPSVVQRAHAQFEGSQSSERIRAIGGNFLTDDLPKDADVISLVRVILDHTDENALGILKAVCKALPNKGALLIAEPMSETPGAEPVSDAYFGFYLLAMGQGQTRTKEHHWRLLKAAGFSKMREIRTRRPFLTRLLVASS